MTTLIPRPDADVLNAIAEGRPASYFQYAEVGFGWQSFDTIKTLLHFLANGQVDVRIKPEQKKMIHWEKGWLPEPLRVAPESGTEVFTTNYGNGAISSKWQDLEWQLRQLASGLIYATEADAQAWIDMHAYFANKAPEVVE